MRPRARLISLIGDELISDEPVAVVELVKNAYDADATKVTVAFSGEDPTDPHTLVISDNGVGMSLDTVLAGWFEPGTVMKRTEDRSPGGRMYQGAKGIGRFAAARLAESLYMETKQKRQAEGVSVLLEWGRFDEQSYLDEIELDYDIGPVGVASHGTSLTLVNLHARKHWTDDDYLDLHDRLSRLISPFENESGEREIASFEIQLVVPGHPELTGAVEPHRLTKMPKYKLSGRIDTAGAFSGSLEIDDEEVKTYSQHKLGSKDESVSCGPFSVEIRAWDRDPAGLARYMLEFDAKVTAIRNILNRYSGVSIYRDGFRVHPYGEQGNDWLGLDRRTRQHPTMRLANNQVIAAIRISRSDNPELRDRTTREGLVHTPSYHAFVDWFTRILALLEEERYRVRPREDAKPEEVSTLFEVFDMTEVVRAADSELGQRHPVSRLVKKKDSDIRAGVVRLQEHYSRVMMAAGLGQLVDIVVHEIGAPLGRANRALARLERTVKRTLEGSIQETFSKQITDIKAFLEQLGNQREMLMPKTAGRRGRAMAFSVQEEILANLGLFESLLAKQGIRPELRAPKDPLVVHMSRSVLGQVVANLLDNSIYWLTRHHGDGKGGKINIHLSHLESGFRILFCDDGPGIAPEDSERVFDMNFTRKPNGMGLGLFVARQVIDNYGRLVLCDDCELSGACFEALFEQRVGL